MRDFVWHFCGYSDLKWRIDHTNWYDLGPNREADGVVRWSDGRPTTSHGGEGLPFLLRELCRLRPGARVVELGAGLGGLASYILPFLRDLGGTLRSVDSWADSPDAAGSPGAGRRSTAASSSTWRTSAPSAAAHLEPGPIGRRRPRGA